MRSVQRTPPKHHAECRYMGMRSQATSKYIHEAFNPGRSVLGTIVLVYFNHQAEQLMLLFSALGGYYRAEGSIKNVNTIEEYRNIDKAQMLRQSGETVSRNNTGQLDTAPLTSLRYGMQLMMVASTLVHHYYLHSSSYRTQI